ncbi:MAG: hypothetical protein IJC43_00070, partial [Clostridia bacterium]|nr:hypothetical protein [Clostridia bacterium]
KTKHKILKTLSNHAKIKPAPTRGAGRRTNAAGGFALVLPRKGGDTMKITLVIEFLEYVLRIAFRKK